MSIVISEKSWHFKLIKRYNEYGVRENTDLCNYVRAFFGALGMLAMISLICGCISWCALDTIIWGIVCTINHMWLQPQIAASVFIGLVLLVALASLLVGIKWCWEQITYSVKDTAKGPASTLQLAASWWLSVSQKFCVRVDIEK